MVQVAQAEVKYFIKFGSFKNLLGLERSIAQLPQGLRSHVVIVQKNGWYVPFAYYTSNKQALYPKVEMYKRYFRDAHIGSSSNMLSYPLIRNYGTTRESHVVPKRQYIAPTPTYQPPKTNYAPPPTYKRADTYQNVAISEEDNILPTPKPLANRYPTAPQKTYQEAPLITQKVVMKKVEEEDDIFAKKEPQKFKQFSKQMLSGNYYYLAYKKTENNPDLLIKVTFGNHTVNYQPVIGDMKMTNASYLTEGDRLYMFTDTFMRNGSFSKLEEHRSNHFLVSSWVNGKKLNTLRYYYKLNDAKRYLGLSTSDGLAEVLSEGSYDELFIEE
jgi:hypothetical protein